MSALSRPVVAKQQSVEPGFLRRLALACIVLGRQLLVPARLVTGVAVVFALYGLWKSGGALESKALLALLALVLISTFARSLRHIAVWAFYIAGFVAFVQLSRFADETGIPHRAGYPILLDQMMFLGEVPTAWLQTHFPFEGDIRPLVFVFVAIYMSYFLVPHILVVATWRLRPTLFPRLPLALILTLHLGMLVYFLLPTVPPWLANEYDQTPEMTRIVPELLTSVDSTGYDTAARVAGENDVGAMPSLHMALTVVVAIAASSFGRVGKYLGALYAAMMGLSLVYLGEHYVIDVVAGAAVAYAGWKASGWALTARTRRPLTQESDGEVSDHEPAARLDIAA